MLVAYSGLPSGTPAAHLLTDVVQPSAGGDGRTSAFIWLGEPSQKPAAFPGLKLKPVRPPVWADWLPKGPDVVEPEAEKPRPAWLLKALREDEEELV